MLVPLLLIISLFFCVSAASAGECEVKVSAQPLHTGRINPMLFGNFIELLDDLVPGMWAEMLNDRGFDGVTKPANWCYYNGEPNICDVEWEKNDTWTLDNTNAFNGSFCAALTSSKETPGTLSQPCLAVTKDAKYVFSCYLRANNPDLTVLVILKAKLPDGSWLRLSESRVTNVASEWNKHSAEFICLGTSEQVVFEIQTQGEGTLWVDKISLMPKENLNGWRKDVVEAVKDLKPSVIRWGGCVCDPGAYRWKNCIGDRDRRVPFPNTVWGRNDSNDVGIDEFCQFCELVNAEPLICLSFSDGPESAADVVQYCNGDPNTPWGAKRVANGHVKPYNVKYWQLGNELGDAKYVENCHAFCEAMKKADPSVILMASFPSQELLDKVGKEIAYIGPHHYTPNFAECEASFKNLSEMIQRTPGCQSMRIAVTEWNVSAGYWGLMRGKFLTLETALYNAKYLNLLMRHSDIVDIACRSNLTNSLGSGVIETKPTGLLKRPSYYAMKLYADHFKPVPLDIAPSPEGLDLFACASEDRKSLCAFAVNMKPEPVPLSLDLSNYVGYKIIKAHALCDQSDARQLDVMNHWTAPDRVRTVELPITDGKIVLPALSAAAVECSGS